MNVNPHLVGGRSNHSPLTPLGVQQAKRLGQIMGSKNIIPEKVFASPAKRTIDTAQYSLAEMGINPDVLIQDELQELGQGPAEGKPRDEIYTDSIRADIDRLGKDFKLVGGESMNDVGLRMNAWITETFTPPSEGESPARHFVYTHGGAIRYLASHLLGWPHPQTYATFIDNASVSLFTCENGVWQVVYLSRDPDQLKPAELKAKK